MNELFQIEESKSPRLRWMDKHGVWTQKTNAEEYEDPEHAWKAQAAGYVGFGPTEDDAIVELARLMGIALWNEEGAV